jgi:hypothetical protein
VNGSGTSKDERAMTSIPIHLRGMDPVSSLVPGSTHLLQGCRNRPLGQAMADQYL